MCSIPRNPQNILKSFPSQVSKRRDEGSSNTEATWLCCLFIMYLYLSNCHQGDFENLTLFFPHIPGSGAGLEEAVPAACWFRAAVKEWHDMTLLGYKKDALVRWKLLKTGWSQRLPTLVIAMPMRWLSNTSWLHDAAMHLHLEARRENIEDSGSNGAKIFREGWFENHHWLALHDAKAGNVESFVNTHQPSKKHSPVLKSFVHFVLATVVGHNIGPTLPPNATSRAPSCST